MKNINNVTLAGNTVTIYWPEASKSVDEYVVKYRIKGSTDEWEKKKRTEIFIKIDSLNHGTKYEFQVYYVRGGKEIAHTEIREVDIPPGKFDMSCLICIGYCLSSIAISEKKTHRSEFKRYLHAFLKLTIVFGMFVCVTQI